jgi:predicted transcriptional regulator
MLQVRLEEEVRFNLDRYAEFLDANPSYVVSEVLKLLYRKDKAFHTWLAGQHTNKREAISKGESLQLELK